jgi:hypothetical protein
MLSAQSDNGTCSKKNVNLPPLAKSPLHGSSKKIWRESNRSSHLSRETSVMESVNLIHLDESTAL